MSVRVRSRFYFHVSARSVEETTGDFARVVFAQNGSGHCRQWKSLPALDMSTKRVIIDAGQCANARLVFGVISARSKNPAENSAVVSKDHFTRPTLSLLARVVQEESPRESHTSTSRDGFQRHSTAQRSVEHSAAQKVRACCADRRAQQNQSQRRAL